MKTSSVIRLVCWLVIACILVGVLVWGMGQSGFNFSFFPFSCVGREVQNIRHNVLQGDVGAYSESNSYEVPLASIETIDISWVDGSVSVVPYDGATIAFSESSLTGIPEKYALSYAVNGSTLTIQYSVSDINWNTDWWNLSKKLEVLVPKALAGDFKNLRVDAVSASVNVNDISGDKVGLSTVSGSIDATNVTANTLDLETASGSLKTTACTIDSVQANSVSGAIKLEGSFNTVLADAVSGSSSVKSSVCPTRVRMDTVSGACSLAIPESSGFTARYSTVSGGFSCAFPATISNDRATYGDGSADFSFNTVSGSIQIVKN